MQYLSITNLKGIGEKTAGLYNKLGIFSYEDLLYYFPRDYMEYSEPVSLLDAVPGDVISIKATVLKKPLMRRAGKLQIVSAYLKTDTDVITAVWFHMPYLTKSLHPGQDYIFRGRIEIAGSKYHFEQPIIFEPDKYSELLNTLQPIYPLTKGITNQSITKSVKNLMLDKNYRNVELRCSDDKRDEVFNALEEIHFPKDYESLIGARKHLVYDEFFLFILRLRLVRKDNDRVKNDFNIISVANTERLIEALPYKLTDAQMRVWREIEEDLSKSVSMSRLVQGDVGSGKTIIAILAAIKTCMNGYQTALMAPTEILATQHYEYIKKLFKDNNIDLEVVLLTGSMSGASKKEVYKKMESGEAKIVVGTHALIQKKANYKNLALVITDEQHRFGVRQREVLSKKNETDNPHILVMSATPIPRTLAIIVYGDLDISIIDQVPARRLPIKNCVVNEDYRNTAYKFITKEVREGHQAYIICPLVEESEGLEAEDVVTYTERLKENLPSDITVAFLHGKMKQDEKNRIMDAFYKNDINVLVSTTVVEVGVNVPNATVMLVENADRFGLAQLHQLRGRIGRGDQQSYCIFMSGNKNKNTVTRLEILNKSNDGFYIASEDMKLRGPGDLFGIRQSGDIRFRLGDIFNDAEILKEAADGVTKLLNEDPDLSMPEHSYLRREIDKMNREGIVI